MQTKTEVKHTSIVKKKDTYYTIIFPKKIAHKRKLSTVFLKLIV